MEKSCHEIHSKHVLLVVPICICCPSLTSKSDFFPLLLELAYNLISRFFQGCALNRNKMKIFQGLI